MAQGRPQDCQSISVRIAKGGPEICNGFDAGDDRLHAAYKLQNRLRCVGWWGSTRRGGRWLVNRAPLYIKERWIRACSSRDADRILRPGCANNKDPDGDGEDPSLWVAGQRKGF